jgi:hypothetical protein
MYFLFCACSSVIHHSGFYHDSTHDQLNGTKYIDPRPRIPREGKQHIKECGIVTNFENGFIQSVFFYIIFMKCVL